MKLRLIIKGPPAVAMAAARARGAQVLESTFRGETECTTVVAVAPKTAIQQWFGEPPHLAPYPPGALLYFVKLW
jgi:hypothetical protein